MILALIEEVRLQKQLAQLSFVQIELFHSFLVFASLTRFSQQPIFNNRVQHYAFGTWRGWPPN
jgi:hypothetical protein